jgi:hypothetical protein
MENLLRQMHETRLRSRSQPSRVDPAGVVLPWLARQTWWNYPWFRPHLLEFGVREVLLPDVLVQVLAHRPELTITKNQHLAHAIGTDWALRAAYRACVLTLTWPPVV